MDKLLFAFVSKYLNNIDDIQTYKFRKIFKY